MMNSGGAISDSMEGVARTAAFGQGIEESAAVGEKAPQVFSSWKQHAADIDNQIKALKLRLAAVQAGSAEHLGQPEAKDREAQELAAEVAIKDRLQYLRTIKMRVNQVEKALRHAGAVRSAFERMHELLLQELKRLAGEGHIEFLQDDPHREKLEQAWHKFIKFINMGRLAVREDEEQESGSVDADIPAQALQPREESQAR